MSDSNDFKQAALDYHRCAPAGKIKVTPTKPLVTQRDLSLAYSPGVAAACEAIVADPTEVSELTARGNLVARDHQRHRRARPRATSARSPAKPVMEGKGVLFQKFAGIDVFDIEIDERDPDKLVDIIAALEPTFGGINLEDIKAPECFEVERKLRAADEDSGLPRRPARHRDHRRRGGAQRARTWSARTSARSSSSRPAPARPASPASTCSSALGVKPREHPGSSTATA